MLGSFITRLLILVFGYTYPAFECFKTVEKNRIEIEELRFWCQYWIIVAVLTVFERIGDIFISWLPLYGEMKLALFIYLWHPKTKGTGYVYETFLRPYVAKHEPDIDRSLQEVRTRAWDLAISYWQNSTKLSQTALFQVVQYLAAQPGKITKSKNEKSENPDPTSAAPPPSPTGSPSFHRAATNPRPPPGQKRPPLPPIPPGTANHRAVGRSPKSDAVQVHLHSQAEFIRTHEEPEPDSTNGNQFDWTHESESGADPRERVARLRLRRSKGFH